MTRAIWPDGFYIEYDRLVTGELNQVRENGATSGVGVLATFGYDSFGRRTSKTFGYGAATYYTYDGVSRLTALGIDYTGTANDLSENFTYNPASQIVSVARTNDAYAWTGHTNGSTATVVNGLNQLVTVGSNVATYDAKGNLTADPITGQPFSYGPQNEFRGNSSLWLAYTALGRVADTLVNWSVNKQYMFDGLQVASVYTPGTGLTERYVWGDGPDELIAWYDGAGTAGRRYAQTDERGSLLAYSDSSGNVLGINRYDEYGRPQSSNTGRFQFTGQMWMSELAFHFYKARAYDPRSGKFPQTDPIGYEAGPNLYGYVLADPINLTDPLGLDCVATGSRLCPVDSPSGVTIYGSLFRIGVTIGGGVGPGDIQSGLLPREPGASANPTKLTRDRDTLCAIEADRLGKAGGTIAAGAIAGTQFGGIGGAILGGTIGAGVAMLQNEFPRFGGFFESAGAAATGGTFGLLSSQYDQAFKVVFSQAPGVAQIGGGALGNAAFHTMRTGAINGAAGAARLGAASGLGYLAAYLATYKYAYNKCMS